MLNLEEIHKDLVYIHDGKLIIDKNKGYEIVYDCSLLNKTYYKYLGFKRNVSGLDVYKLHSGNEVLLVVKDREIYLLELNERDIESHHYISELLLNSGIDLHFIYINYINREHEMTLNEARVLYRGYFGTEGIYALGHKLDNLMWEDIGLYVISYKGEISTYIDYLSYHYVEDLERKRYSIMLNLKDYNHYLVEYEHLGHRDNGGYNINENISRIKEYKDILKISLIDDVELLGMGNIVQYIYKDKILLKNNEGIKHRVSL